MPYLLRQWPGTVYSRAKKDFPEELPDIDAALLSLSAEGPQPDGFAFRQLGKKKDYLWQINLRLRGRQIRILYALYEGMIVIFGIHKKSSPKEQERAYTSAMNRKRQAEQVMKQADNTHVELATVY